MRRPRRCATQNVSLAGFSPHNVVLRADDRAAIGGWTARDPRAKWMAMK
jgi:Rps23 Pro-64 3,4-dihydroxylase Tpa1-like proline 4-hydroxylase